MIQIEGRDVISVIPSPASNNGWSNNQMVLCGYTMLLHLASLRFRGLRCPPIPFLELRGAALAAHPRGGRSNNRIWKSQPDETEEFAPRGPICEI